LRKVLSLAFIFYATNLAATTYYVTTTGSDSNDGSLSAPWRTITHAAAVAVAGDTAIVQNGTYQESPSFSHSGTSASPITFRSQNKWGAVIAPTSSQVASHSGLVSSIGGSYVIVQGFEILGPSDGSANVGIKAGAAGSPNTGDQILGNKIHQIGTTTCHGGAGAQSASTNGVVNGNLIYNIGPPPSFGRCNQWQGIYINDAYGQTVDNNIIMNNAQAGGISFNGEFSGVQANFPSNERACNNTLVNIGTVSLSVGQGFYLDCAAGGICDNNNFSNNIFYYVQTTSFFQVAKNGSSWGSNNLYRNNLISGSGTNYWGGLSQPSSYVNTLTSSPLFVNYTGTITGDYHLQTGSPAINGATSVGAPSTDFDGNVRPQGGAIDIGAYEMVTAKPNAPTSLTANVK
jgi:hypothetical protein